MSARRFLPAVLVAAALLPAPALADHLFILPANTLYSGEGNMTTVDAAGADHVFFFDHRPIALETIHIQKPDGTPAQPLNPLRMRFRSVFDLRLDQQGTWKVASEQTMVTGTFKLNGEERRVGGRGGPPPGGGERQPEKEPAGAPPQAERRQPPVTVTDIPAEAADVHLVETVSRAETFVTAGAPSDTVFKPASVGLEFAPITHPNALVAGETARFRFLIDGHPAPGVAITVLAGGDRYRDDVGEMHLTTGPDGRVAVKWPSAGRYWLGAEAQDAHPAEKRAEVRRMTYAATLEVMTP